MKNDNKQTSNSIFYVPVFLIILFLSISFFFNKGYWSNRNLNRGKRAAYVLKNYKLSYQFYNNAISLDKNNSEAYLERGLYYALIKRDIDKAYNDYVIALNLGEKDFRAYFYIAKYLIEKNEQDKALSYLKILIEDRDLIKGYSESKIFSKSLIEQYVYAHIGQINFIKNNYDHCRPKVL